MKLTEWALEDRPREKMMANGADALTDVELLAILINTGQRGRTAIDIARDLLNSCNNNLIEFSRILFDKDREHGKGTILHGIGPAKICTLKAAFELGRRKERQAEIERLDAQLINDSSALFAQFNQRLSDLDHEELWALYLSRNGKILKRHLIGDGGVDFSPADLRKIVRPALETMASRVCLVHNHPHSHTQPSSADRSLTAAAQKALAFFDIMLTDHIIIADGRYYSFADNGDL